jgi:putative peptidoglycan lipid II flippase
VINAIVAIGLWPWLGWLSPAIATVISSWAMVALLHISSRKFGDVARVTLDTKSKIARVAIASIAMGVVLGAAQFNAGGYFSNGVTQFIWALGLVILGATTYIIFARISGAFRLRELRSAMRL